MPKDDGVDDTTIKVAPPNPHFKTVKLIMACWYRCGYINHTSYRAFVRSTKRLLTY